MLINDGVGNPETDRDLIGSIIELIGHNAI